MKKMIFGLTGMTGAGKTTVCNVFKESGFHVINCDKVARAVTERGKPCLREIADSFGSEVICPDGSLNRKLTGSIVFNDKQKLMLLDSIIYPYITYDIIKEIENTDSRCILLDAPTLFESGIDYICDKIVSVICSLDNSVSRIMARDSITKEAALARLRSQHTAEFYREKSNFCIENNGTPEELTDKAKTIALLLSDK